MFRRLLRFVRAAREKKTVYIPSSEHIPRIWPDTGEYPCQPNLAVLDTATTKSLTELCDDYWNSFLPDCALEPSESLRIVCDSNVHRHAMHILAQRRREPLRWARDRLAHPDYVAREDAAWLISQLADQGELGSDKDAIAEELATLAIRSIEEDTKEVGANTSALLALAKIGGPICLATLRQILASPEWDQDELQWDAAEILSGMTGEPLMHADDPVKAAKDWLKADPER